MRERREGAHSRVGGAYSKKDSIKVIVIYVWVGGNMKFIFKCNVLETQYLTCEILSY